MASFLPGHELSDPRCQTVTIETKVAAAKEELNKMIEDELRDCGCARFREHTRALHRNSFGQEVD